MPVLVVVAVVVACFLGEEGWVSLSGMVMVVGLGGCLRSDVLLALEGRVRGRWVVVVLAVRGWLVVLVVGVLLVLVL